MQREVERRRSSRLGVTFGETKYPTPTSPRSSATSAGSLSDGQECMPQAPAVPKMAAVNLPSAEGKAATILSSYVSPLVTGSEGAEAQDAGDNAESQSVLVV